MFAKLGNYAVFLKINVQPLILEVMVQLSRDIHQVFKSNTHQSRCGRYT